MIICKPGSWYDYASFWRMSLCCMRRCQYQAGTNRKEHSTLYCGPGHRNSSGYFHRTSEHVPSQAAGCPLKQTQNLEMCADRTSVLCAHLFLNKHYPYCVYNAFRTLLLLRVMLSEAGHPRSGCHPERRKDLVSISKKTSLRSERRCRIRHALLSDGVGFFGP